MYTYEIMYREINTYGNQIQIVVPVDLSGPSFGRFVQLLIFIVVSF